MSATATATATGGRAALRLPPLFAGYPVVTEELWLSGPIPEPRPEEAAQVATAVAKRRLEYAAGRHCARRAFDRLGIESGPLLNGNDRAPRWPTGVVGSITHTGTAPDGYCGAAVARSREVAALGLDAELAEPLEENLTRFICTDAERTALLRAEPRLRGLLAKVIFSAKEAVFKAHYPHGNRVLGFHEVEVLLDDAGRTFFAEVRAAPVGPFTPDRQVTGRYLIDDELIVTSMALLP